MTRYAPLFPRCPACREQPTLLVRRLWLVRGEPLPLLQCCDAHRPGSRAPAVPSQRFYDVQPLDAANTEA